MAKKKSTLARNWKTWQRKLTKVVRSKRFARIYLVISLAVLLATTIAWASLSARIQQSNADQLINAYLFDGSGTFHAALFPGQHSFLLKWPIFLAVSLFGSSVLAFSIGTVSVVVATIAGLVAILYWIVRKPLLLGTLCLALASVLLLIPTLPYATGLLPVNMAMITTRNIEYVIYIGALILVLKAKRVWSWQIWASIATLGVLIASDKLFASFTIGGALLVLVAYALFRRWQYVRMGAVWLGVGILATTLSIGGLWLINVSGLTHIVNESGAGPYNLVSSLRDVGLAIIYAIFGLLTNLGANPAFDATIVKNIPAQLVSRLFSIGGLAFVANLAILVGSIVAGYRLVQASFALPKRKLKKPKIDAPQHLAIMLIASTIAALGVFIVTSHYYPVDARYLAISLFAVFIVGAVYVRTLRFKPQRIVLLALILLVSCILGSYATINTYHAQRAALAPIDKRNALVAAALAHHPVNTLVGDYWRVLPTKLAASGKLNVLPLGSCAEPRNALTSTVWQSDLKNHSFAYLLSFDHSLTDYPQCSLAQINAHYGRPDSSVLIAGSLDKPTELLLFYDHGTAHSHRKPTVQTKGSTTGPIGLDQLTHATCVAPTVMNIVAHQDDDLLFMNPDLSRDISAGYCIRTVYVTAGDAGSDAFYWLSREQGSEAAYSHMLGIGDSWTQRTIKLNEHQYVSIANPVGNPRISLIFMHLPDGNITGSGFAASHFESLARLEAGKIEQMQSTDGQSQYTAGQLTTALTQLMQTYKPTELRTQAPRNMSHTYSDHSDHMAVGRFTSVAYQQYAHPDTSLKYYIGYPIRARTSNLSQQEFADKQATFLTYAKFDGGVCQSAPMCDHTPTYHAYLSRQYQLTD